MAQSLRSTHPIRITIGSDDVTQYADSFTFSSVDPGGFEAANFSFPRDLPSTIRGLPIRIETGLRTAWEGRVSQVQRSLGHKTVVMGEGYGALLHDAEGSMVFVDRDLTKWQGPTYARQVAMVNASNQLASTQVTADPANNSPALAMQIQDSWVSPYIPICEAWYDSGPQNLIAKIYYTWSQQNANDGGVAWHDFVNISQKSDTSGTVETSSNLNAAGPVSGYFSPATAYRYGILQHYYTTTPAGSQGATFAAYWQNLAAYGNHGLTGRGADPVGFYPSDIVGWVLAQIAGLQAGTIQATDAAGYIVPHSAYYTPVTLDTIINDMALIQGWHWGVWESPSPLTGNPLPRFDFKPRPSPGAFTASCRRQDCDTLDIREDLSQQYNAAVVTWSNVDGTQGAVTVTTDNPILDQAGIASRTVVLNGGTMTPATAAVFGAEALALINSQARVAGSADIINAIDGPGAPWLLRAGQDRLRIVDLPSSDAFGAYNDVPIQRVECSVSSSGITTSVELGTGANLIETLNARLAASTFLAGSGA